MTPRDKFWYAVFFVLSVFGLHEVIGAGNAFGKTPGVSAVVVIAGWSVFLFACVAVLAFLDYRGQRARGKVRTRVQVFEKLLRTRGGSPVEREG